MHGGFRQSGLPWSIDSALIYPYNTVMVSMKYAVGFPSPSNDRLCLWHCTHLPSLGGMSRHLSQKQYREREQCPAIDYCRFLSDSRQGRLGVDLLYAVSNWCSIFYSTRKTEDNKPRISYNGLGLYSYYRP
jgi:hypothetical protein